MSLCVASATTGDSALDSDWMLEVAPLDLGDSLAQPQRLSTEQDLGAFWASQLLPLNALDELSAQRSLGVTLGPADESVWSAQASPAKRSPGFTLGPAAFLTGDVRASERVWSAAASDLSAPHSGILPTMPVEPGPVPPHLDCVMSASSEAAARISQRLESARQFIRSEFTRVCPPGTSPKTHSSTPEVQRDSPAPQSIGADRVQRAGTPIDSFNRIPSSHASTSFESAGFFQPAPSVFFSLDEAMDPVCSEDAVAPGFTDTRSECVSASYLSFTDLSAAMHPVASDALPSAGVPIELDDSLWSSVFDEGLAQQQQQQSPHSSSSTQSPGAPHSSSSTQSPGAPPRSAQSSEPVDYAPSCPLRDCSGQSRHVPVIKFSNTPSDPDLLRQSGLYPCPYSGQSMWLFLDKPGHKHTMSPTFFVDTEDSQTLNELPVKRKRKAPESQRRVSSRSRKSANRARANMWSRKGELIAFSSPAMRQRVEAGLRKMLGSAWANLHAVLPQWAQLGNSHHKFSFLMQAPLLHQRRSDGTVTLNWTASFKHKKAGHASVLSGITQRLQEGTLACLATDLCDSDLRLPGRVVPAEFDDVSKVTTLDIIACVCLDSVGINFMYPADWSHARTQEQCIAYSAVPYICSKKELLIIDPAVMWIAQAMRSLFACSSRSEACLPDTACFPEPHLFGAAPMYHTEEPERFGVSQPLAYSQACFRGFLLQESRMHLPFSVVKSHTRAPFEQVFRSTTIPQFMWWSSYNLVGVHQYCTHVLRCTSISGGTVSERSAKSLSTEQKGLYWASIRVRSFQVDAYNTEATHLTFSMQADKSTRVTRAATGGDMCDAFPRGVTEAQCASMVQLTFAAPADTEIELTNGTKLDLAVRPGELDVFLSLLGELDSREEEDESSVEIYS